MHATCVAVGPHAALIRGASGRGKSGLALQLLAMGAVLVSDDRTRLWRAGDALMADAPDTIRGRIEARGVGILRVPASRASAGRPAGGHGPDRDRTPAAAGARNRDGRGVATHRKCTACSFPGGDSTISQTCSVGSIRGRSDHAGRPIPRRRPAAAASGARDRAVGAGRSTAIRALEDMDFEAIDNMPFSLLPRLLEGRSPLEKPLALGLDVRNRDFSTEALMTLIERLDPQGRLSAAGALSRLPPEILQQRFSETRRRHPWRPRKRRGRDRSRDRPAGADPDDAPICWWTRRTCPRMTCAPSWSAGSPPLTGAAGRFGAFVFLQARGAARPRHGVGLPFLTILTGNRTCARSTGARPSRGLRAGRSAVRKLSRPGDRPAGRTCCRPSRPRGNPISPSGSDVPGDSIAAWSWRGKCRRKPCAAASGRCLYDIANWSGAARAGFRGPEE